MGAVQPGPSIGSFLLSPFRNCSPGRELCGLGQRALHVDWHNGGEFIWGCSHSRISDFLHKKYTLINTCGC